MATFSKGSGYSKADLKTSGKPIILYGRMYTKYETIIRNVDTFAEEKAGSVYSESGDVIVPASGETAQDISRASVVANSGILLGGDINIIHPNNELNPGFLALTISNGNQQKKLSMKAQGATIVHLHNEDLKGVDILCPSIDEQTLISEFFERIDNTITLHQRKLDGMKLLKKSLLQKMFPKNGESVPEVRFPGFTDAWTQSKFGPLVTIERGGSPRPIDRFITDSPNGLNWVKIGDAPKQGNYITKTAEKIRPEGLSKTREVHPGDLILSNSMSFGKPYIMAINGCIHDGWLAIRNYQNSFDLKFLCVLLGTSQMLSQYKAMAAGSTVNNLNKELVGSTMVKFPCLDEQRKIGRFFESFEDSLSINQREIDELQKLKTSFSQQMFV